MRALVDCKRLLTRTYETWLCHCWQYFKSMAEIGKNSIAWEQIKFTRYDYTFGDCKEKDLYLQAHIHFDKTKVLNKIIIRDWLNVTKTPVCIRIRQSNYESQVIYKTPEFAVQICAARIVYIHHRRRWIYYYFEWFKPVEVLQHADWDLYFYSRGDPDWTVEEETDTTSG